MIEAGRRTNPFLLGGWGLFCACSWTWCIGMYLPVILIERFGWWGFIVFGIPNVLGCGAFGYVVATRERSERLVDRHGSAMAWFSFITIAYHMFFLVWLFAALVPVFAEEPWLAVGSCGLVLAIGTVLSFLPNRDWLWLSVLVYATSIAAFVSVGVQPLREIRFAGSEQLADLAWIAPAIIFGFLLCPYLDLTFHRALQRGGKHSFAVFAVAFAVMILLTCALWYGGYDGRWLAPLGLAHVLAQTVFTVGAHLREIRQTQAISSRAVRAAAMTAPLAGGAVLYIAWGFSSSEFVGEQWYLRFLAFYGLVFPGYVLIAMSARHTPAMLKWLGCAVVLAGLPLYELGFLHGQPWLVAIPIAALLITRAIFPMFSQPAIEQKNQAATLP